MDPEAVKHLLGQQATFLKTTLDQQAEVNSRNLNALAEIVRGIQDEFAKRGLRRSGEDGEKQASLTTKRAFTLLPKYSGKPEEFDDWRFQMTQFFAEDPNFLRILEWAESELPSQESGHRAAVEEQDRLQRRPGRRHQGVPD